MNQTVSEVLQKLQKYCTYQERCHKEVRQKLREIGVYQEEDQNEVMDCLIREKYLDEERFARAFARGKFRMKRWGRDKISRELKLREISNYCMQAGLSEIPDEEYRSTLQRILEKKYMELKSVKLELLRKKKAVFYAVSRGYEMDLSWSVLNDLLA